MKKTKKLKGMTLVEIIIAIAVFAVLGVILITAGTTIDNLTRATTNLKDKLVTQSPYAANQRVQYEDSNGNTVSIPCEQLAHKINVMLVDAKGATESDQEFADRSIKGTYNIKDKDNKYIVIGNVYTYKFSDKMGQHFTATAKFEDTKVTIKITRDPAGTDIITPREFNMTDSGLWNISVYHYTSSENYELDIDLLTVVMKGDRTTDGSGTNVKFSYNNPTCDIDGVKYDTRDVYLEQKDGINDMTAEEKQKYMDDYNEKPNHGLNFQYIIVDTTLPPAPTAAATT